MTLDSEHPLTSKMTVPELEACGCKHCLDALERHKMLDQLIESTKRMRAQVADIQKSLDDFEVERKRTLRELTLSFRRTRR